MVEAFDVDRKTKTLAAKGLQGGIIQYVFFYIIHVRHGGRGEHVWKFLL